MKKYLIPIYIVLFLIGATALWYFGHHRPAQKILEAEPKRVYKSIPLQPTDLSVKPMPSDSIQKPREEDTDIEVENIDNAATSEKIDDSQVHSEDADSVEPMSQEDLSVEDAAAAEAFEKYLTAESDYQAAQERLKKALILHLDQIVPANEEAEEALAESDHQAVHEVLDKALDPKNLDEIASATEVLKEAHLRRKEALQNLAPYSEDAVKMLAQVKEAERRENEARAESERRLRELRTQFRNMQDAVEELEKSP